MVLMNVLRNVLNAIVNAERTNKRQVMVRPCSKVVIRFLRVMQKHGKRYLFIHKTKYIWSLLFS